MTRLLLLSVLLLTLATPAEAHKLRVFATVEGEDVTGYAFFIGGSRAQGAQWTATAGDGSVIAQGNTDSDGGFRLTPPRPVTAAITVTVDTREGHIASAVLPAARFGGAAVASAVERQTMTRQTAANEKAAPARAPSPDETAALEEAAVQRQAAPLLQRIEEMDSRLRTVDIFSGVFLIIGLAGIALWARGRRR